MLRELLQTAFYDVIYPYKRSFTPNKNKVVNAHIVHAISAMF